MARIALNFHSKQRLIFIFKNYFYTYLEFVNHFHHSLCYRVHNTALLQLTITKSWGGPIAYWFPTQKFVGPVPFGFHGSCAYAHLHLAPRRWA